MPLCECQMCLRVQVDGQIKREGALEQIFKTVEVKNCKYVIFVNCYGFNEDDPLRLVKDGK